jgi:hypothetical protein
MYKWMSIKIASAFPKAISSSTRNELRKFLWLISILTLKIL